MPRVRYSPASSPPAGEHTFRAIAPFEQTTDRNGGPAFRIRLVNDNGEPLTYFTSQRLGPGSTLRAVLEAAAGARFPAGDLDVDTDQCIGKPFRGELIAHPTAPNLRRLAWVSALDGTVRSVIRASGGKTWTELAAEAAQETPQ